MALPWFKFYGGEYLSDPKIFGLNSGQRSCWITLLCLASQSTTPGIIPHLTEQQLMLASGLDFQSEEWDVVVGVLTKFEALEMIELNDDEVIISHFQKRQAGYLTEAEKKAKYRAKYNQERTLSTPDEGTVSTPNRIDKIREDKNTLQPVAAEDWDSEKYIAYMQGDSRPFIQIISVYWRVKGINFPTKSAMSATLKRELRAAKALEGYPATQIMKTMDYLQAKAEYKWTLETVAKFINEV